MPYRELCRTTANRFWIGGMNSIALDAHIPTALRVEVSDDTLSVELSDGRAIAVPLVWFPRLAHGTAQERNHWRLIGQGLGIHWPDLDEDISVANLLAGNPSAESQTSLQGWLQQRAAAGDQVTEEDDSR
jgi:hypothetical protein